MKLVTQFLKRPNVRKWISDVIKIGFGVSLGGVIFFGVLFIFMKIEGTL